MAQSFVPGMKIIVRGEEWLVQRVDKASEEGKKPGEFALTAVGLSSLTRGQERVFLTSLERKIEAVDPVSTKFVADLSPRFRNSRLFIESQLRQSVPTDARIYVGDKGAIDPLQFQFTPALKALAAPRARILISDAVGLGKTIECGILLSELIRRGRGKRILVLAVKSMLEQFQKELWSRFTIPLVRLDSVGVQRVRKHIPSNANPFYYYDKVIISIDTLKAPGEYKNYLENSRWDAVVIDEAHNVAERNNSQRSKLAKLVATRCDSLIMLTATPHDGKRRSFASLVDMLDPTAIADPDNYGAEDVQDYVVRRFKKDVKAEIAKEFPERTVEQLSAPATSEEEAAFDALANLKFERVDANRRDRDVLFRTVLEKALFSSPDACRETVQKRIALLEKEPEKEPEQESAQKEPEDPARAERKRREAQTIRDAKLRDAQKLRAFDALLAKITPARFSRYRLLLDMLRPSGPRSIGWSPNVSNDRIVIFAERVKTVKFLAERLRADLNLTEDQVVALDASLGDVEIMDAVAKFGVETSPARILVCTDVASEGINLHYCAHRLVHFDVPWSLITFQQRNGRIDRYGQEKTPEIRYLTVGTANEKIKADAHILDLLIEKDKEVVKTIGDPTEFTKCCDAETEELAVGRAMERDGESDLEFDDLFAEFAADAPDSEALGAELHTKKISEVLEFRPGANRGEIPTLYSGDYEYVCDALNFVNSAARKRTDIAGEALRYERDDAKSSMLDGRALTVYPNESLRAKLNYLPPEILGDSESIYLCDAARTVRDAYGKCLKEEGAWPEIQYLWDMHPVVQYLNETVLAAFGRLRAPLLRVGDRLAENETLFIASAVVANGLSVPTVSRFYGLLFRNGQFAELKPLDAWIKALRLDAVIENPDALSNPDEQNLVELSPTEQNELGAMLPDAVAKVRAAIFGEADARQKELSDWSRKYGARLKEWRERRLQYLGLFDKSEYAPTKGALKEREARLEVERVFRDFDDWTKTAAKLGCGEPSVAIAAVLKGGLE